MRFFRVVADNAAPGTRPLAWIERGAHRWALPNRIGCPDCTIYSAVGPAYPAVDLSTLPDADALLTPSAVSWRQFREVATRLTPLAGPERPLSPGTTLGPFTGTVRGGSCDFLFGSVHLLFATPAACARLVAASVALPPTVPARLRGRSRVPTDFVEFDVPRGGRLAVAGYTLRAPAPCGTCGRWDRTLDRVVLETGSVPNGVDLLRPLNHPTVVLATERFTDTVRAAELTGVAFEPVETAADDAERDAAAEG